MNAWKHTQPLAALLGIAALLASATRANSGFAIDWYTIDGGGGTSSGGNYTLSGTIGQPDAGFSSGGQYDLYSGFWGVTAGSSGTCSSSLFIAHSGSDVTITWSGQPGECVLEYTDNLNSPIIWQPVSPQPVGTIYTAPANQPHRFYRLHAE